MNPYDTSLAALLKDDGIVKALRDCRASKPGQGVSNLNPAVRNRMYARALITQLNKLTVLGAQRKAEILAALAGDVA